jgi:hypothetical protein
MDKEAYFQRHSDNFVKLKNILEIKEVASDSLLQLIMDYEDGIEFYENYLLNNSDVNIIKHLKLSRVAVSQLVGHVGLNHSPEIIRTVNLRLFNAGLANRLRALCGSIVVSRVLSVNLNVSWIPDEHCDCSIQLIFPNDLVNYFKSLSPVEYASSLMLNSDDCLEIVGNPPAWTLWDKYCSNKIKWVDFLCEYRAVLRDLFNIHLNSFILCASNNFVDQNFSDDVVGVHIRSTDFSKHYEKIYPGRTLAAVDDFIVELKNIKASRVFLATDSIDVRKVFASDFPGQVCMVDHNFQSSSFRQTSVISALMDIYLLSKCVKLIATYGSSFSGMAADISGVEVSYI